MRRSPDQAAGANVRRMLFTADVNCATSTKLMHKYRYNKSRKARAILLYCTFVPVGLICRAVHIRCFSRGVGRPYR